MARLAYLVAALQLPGESPPPTPAPPPSPCSGWQSQPVRFLCAWSLAFMRVLACSEGTT